MSGRSSVLVPLSQKTNPAANTTGLINPKVGTSLSSTPSPTATPAVSRPLDKIALPPISPAPSPMRVSPSLLAPLPMISLPAVPSSPTKVPSPLPMSSGPAKESPVSITNLSMIGLPTLPASPSKVSSSKDMSKVPLIETSVLGKAEQSINNSLANIQSPVLQQSSPSLERLGSFSQIPKFEPSPVGSLLNVPDSNLKPLSNEPTSVDKSETTMKFHDHKGMLVDSSVEQMLTKSGYLPVDKILTKDENDILMCQYIKAIDPTGRTAFVDLDCEGYVSVGPEDMAVTTASKASVLPYSVKMGTYECASSDVCGVAFECDNEICTLKRNEKSLNPSEDVFSTEHKQSGEGHKEHGMLSNHPVAYPIVSMSDIKENPDRVACSIRDSHNRMRNVEFNQASRDSSMLVEATNALNNEARRFAISQKSNADKLKTTIDQLETVHETMKRRPPVTDKARANLRSVRYNLRRRHDLVIDHLKLSEAVNSRIHRVKELLEEIKTLNDYGDRLFEGLEYEYHE